MLREDFQSEYLVWYFTSAYLRKSRQMWAKSYVGPYLIVREVTPWNVVIQKVPEVHPWWSYRPTKTVYTESRQSPGSLELDHPLLRVVNQACTWILEPIPNASCSCR